MVANGYTTDASDTEGETTALEDESKPYSGVGCCCFCIEAGHAGVVQMFGDFNGYTEPGIAFYCWPICSMRSVSLAVKQIMCQTSCKTKDNVTLTIRTAVQYRVNKQKIKTAVFDIINPEAQIEAAVDNVVRSSVPAMDLDAAYENKETLCKDILLSVANMMDRYGHLILNVLITDLSPEASVLSAMNEINAARRQREAAVERGEAEKLLQVKAAEADAEAKHLSGMGIARMRKAIADGFKDSMVSMHEGGLSPQESMHMMVTTQYMDTLKDFANNPSSSSIMVPHGPGVTKDIEEQVRNGFIAANALTAAPGQASMAAGSRR
jgi:regulator of protease activity HflC (stomatin/prohibitin superfamily)